MPNSDQGQKPNRCIMDNAIWQSPTVQNTPALVIHVFLELALCQLSGKSLGKNNISQHRHRSFFIIYTVIFVKWHNNEVKLLLKLYKLLHLGLLQNPNVPQSLYRQSDGFRSSIVCFIFWCIRSVIRNQSEIKLHVRYQIKQSNTLVSGHDKQSLSTCTTHAKPLQACKG